MPHPPDLLVDGYLSHMFGPQDAETYHTSLLGTESDLIPRHATPPEGIFVAATPPGVEPNQGVWELDYAIKDAGVVIPQQIWAPRKPADAQRYVHHEQLRPPIFFALKDGSLGLPLTAAAAGSCMYLRGAEQVAAVGRGSHAQIRINWCGYRHLEWSEQIMTQRGSSPPKETISHEKFAKYVAGRVLKFMEIAKVRAYHDNEDPAGQRWLIADHHIAPRHVILIGAVHVSQGSWMPILQLNDRFVLSLGNRPE